MTSWRHIAQQLPQCQASTILVINLTSSCSWHALNLLQSWGHTTRFWTYICMPWTYICEKTDVHVTRTFLFVGRGGDSGVGGGVTHYWCILVTNWRRQSITILCRSLVCFFFSSRWAEFLHVVSDLIENRSTVFFSSVCVSFSSKKVCKKPGGSFWDLLLKPFLNSYSSF